MTLALEQAIWDAPQQPLRVVRSSLTPRLEEGEVLVEIELATICGSDLHTARGDRPGPAPSVLGHEQVGRVAAVGGSRVCLGGAPVQPGDRIVWSVTSSCSACDRCARGLPQKCRRLRKFGHEERTDARPLDGGLANYCIVPAGAAIVRMPPHVPATVAAPTSCSTATVAAALGVVGTDLAGRTVLITGGGMLGLTAAAMACVRGADVVLVEPDPTRRATAVTFGAHTVLDPSDVPAGRYDVALDMSGHPDAVTSCLTALDVGGTAVLVGSVSPGPTVALDPQAVVRGLLTVTGVHNYHPRDLVAATDFIAEHHARFPFAKLIGQPYALADVNAAFRAAARREHPREAIRSC